MKNNIMRNIKTNIHHNLVNKTHPEFVVEDTEGAFKGNIKITIFRCKEPEPKSINGGSNYCKG